MVNWDNCLQRLSLSCWLRRRILSTYWQLTSSIDSIWSRITSPPFYGPSWLLSFWFLISDCDSHQILSALLLRTPVITWSPVADTILVTEIVPETESAKPSRYLICSMSLFPYSLKSVTKLFMLDHLCRQDSWVVSTLPLAINFVDSYCQMSHCFWLSQEYSSLVY